jgi:hypothetical protein
LINLRFFVAFSVEKGTGFSKTPIDMMTGSRSLKERAEKIQGNLLNFRGSHICSVWIKS